MITVALITLILAVLTVAIFSPTSPANPALQLRTCDFILVKQNRDIKVQYVNRLANENTQTTVVEPFRELSNRLSDDA